MTKSAIPFLVVLFASLLALPAAYLDSKWITYLPDIALAFALLLLQFQNGRTFTLGVRPGWVIVLGALAVHAAIQIAATGGHGSLGTVGLVLTTFVFVQLLLHGDAATLPARLAKQMVLVYGLHMLYLYVELGLRTSGFDFLSLFGQAVNVTKYKEYNSAHFLWLIGYPETFYGLNGLLLGSQSAGQIMLAGAVIVAPWYKHSAFPLRTSVFAFALFALATLVAINMTVAVIFVVIAVALIYGYPASRLSTRVLRVATPIVVFLNSAALAAVLFFRVPEGTSWTSYTTPAMEPISAFRRFTLFQQLFGLGRYEVVAKAADFGVMILVNQIGAVIVVLLLTAVAWLVLTTVREARRTLALMPLIDDPSAPDWIWLAAASGLVVIINTLSLGHYTPAIELGGRHLFAWHCAMAYVATLRLKAFRRRAAAEVVAA